MKFSEVEKSRWEDLKPYMDTCLLPLTGLTGEEEPWEATEALEKLRDAMADIEKRYIGRMVTYPALHYIAGRDMTEQVNQVCGRLRQAGFRYVVLITAASAFSGMSFAGADLFLAVHDANDGSALERISELWHREAEKKPYA